MVPWLGARHCTCRRSRAAAGDAPGCSPASGHRTEPSRREYETGSSVGPFRLAPVIAGIMGHLMAELRAAVETFIDLYNEQWLPEKNGFLSPSPTREAWYAQHGAEVAA